MRSRTCGGECMTIIVTSDMLVDQMGEIANERDTYRELCGILIEDMKNAIEYQKNGLGSIRFLQASIEQAESILGEKNGTSN